MMQQESWVGIQMMNEYVRNDLINESNHRRLINRWHKENSGLRKGIIFSLVSSIADLINSGSKVHNRVESR